VFDESYLKNTPYDFVLKYGNVIPGWHEGFEGIPAGSKVTLILPYATGYGEGGSPEIPPYSTLQFETELLKVTPNKNGAPAAPMAP
jgi:FKBP-type peptidyl-prolyl cis-trans isomerase